MNLALSAELRKLRATRSTTAAAAAALGFGAALAVANVTLAGTEDNPPVDPDTLQHVVRAPTAIIAFVMLLLGILSAASEYRHNTIITTLLAQPRRAAVAAAKTTAVSLTGLALALLTAGISVAVAWPLLLSRDAPPADLAAVPSALIVLTGTAILYGALGVALGLLLRNQAVALTVALLWYFVVERVLPMVTRAPHAADWLPRGASDAFARLGDAASTTRTGMLTPWQGASLLGAYAAAMVALATLALTRRDQV
jgi:ABC-type transport system involved in multi-copper enzyme maturation permease subunit